MSDYFERCKKRIMESEEIKLDIISKSSTMTYNTIYSVSDLEITCSMNLNSISHKKSYFVTYKTVPIYFDNTEDAKNLYKLINDRYTDQLLGIKHDYKVLEEL